MCWDSAKVQLNSGILERRRRNWDKALLHFEHARAMEPGYCEPTYWIGATMINAGKDTDASLKVRSCTALYSHAELASVALCSSWRDHVMLHKGCFQHAKHGSGNKDGCIAERLTVAVACQELEKAVDCKYVAVEAFSALHQVCAQ